MISHSPLPNKVPGQVLTDVAAALGLAMGFAFGSAWCFLSLQSVHQFLIATITPIGLTIVFYRARD